MVNLKKYIIRSLKWAACMALLLAAALIALAACSEPLQEKETSITISFGGARAALLSDAEKWNIKAVESVLPIIEYAVTLTGPAGTQPQTRTVKGSETAKFTVAAGKWQVKVQALCFDIPLAKGSKTVDVITGESSAVSIQMEKDGNYTFHAVDNADDWEIASTGIGNICIIITDDIEIAGSPSTTFPTLIKNVSIISNGHSMNKSGLNGYLLNISEGQTVTIKDLNLIGVSGSFSPLVYIDGGKLVMEGNSSISGNKKTASNSDGNGGGVYIDGGTFIMNGGTISDNEAKTNGGGVYIDEGTFTMNGGEISGNKVTATINGHGGGVYVGNGGTFTMNGSAKVSGNINTDYGGGVAIDGGSFIMRDDASVTGNSTTDSWGYGGGVHIASGNFTMYNNASVSGNDSSVDGGGVYIAGGSFTMNNKTSVHSNNANGTAGGNGDGGGVCVSAGAAFTMNGGSIYNNAANGNGNSLYVYGGGEAVIGNATHAPGGDNYIQNDPISVP